MREKGSFLIGFILLFSIALKSQDKSFPYKLNHTDFVILPLAYGIGTYTNIKKKQVKSLEYNDLVELDYKSINAIDRSAVHNWNAELGHYSDITRTTLVNLPIAVIAGQAIGGNFKNMFTLGLMYAETMVLTSEVTSLVKTLTQRKRPYLYSTKLNTEEKAGFLEYDVSNSFFSGHTSMAFASAVFLSKTVTDIYGKSLLSQTLWVASLSAAGLTGYLRYASGKHFPTDVLMGAMAGSAIGYLIPVLHKSQNMNQHFNIELSVGYFEITYSI